jgi:hypothetical protein
MIAAVFCGRTRHRLLPRRGDCLVLGLLLFLLQRHLLSPASATSPSKIEDWSGQHPSLLSVSGQMKSFYKCVFHKNEQLIYTYIMRIT